MTVKLQKNADPNCKQLRTEVVSPNEPREKKGKHIYENYFKPLHNNVHYSKCVMTACDIIGLLCRLGKKKWQKISHRTQQNTCDRFLGFYWGYAVRLADSLSAVFSKCPFEGGYDLTLGTSERGAVVDDCQVCQTNNVCVNL